MQFIICNLVFYVANRKKAEAHETGGGQPPSLLTPAEELALSLNRLKGDLWAMRFQGPVRQTQWLSKM